MIPNCKFWMRALFGLCLLSHFPLHAQLLGYTYVGTYPTGSVQLGTIDPVSGTFTPVVPIAPGTFDDFYFLSALDSAGHRFFVYLTTITSPKETRLYTVDMQTNAVTSSSPIPSNMIPAGIDFDSGSAQLYGYTCVGGTVTTGCESVQFGTVDPDSGTFTQVVPIISGTASVFRLSAIDSAGHRFFVYLGDGTGGNIRLYTVNTLTNAITFGSTTLVASFGIQFDSDSGQLYSCACVDISCGSVQLGTVDPASGTFTPVVPIVARAVGALSALDSAGHRFFVYLSTITDTRLYTVDTKTNAVTVSPPIPLLTIPEGIQYRTGTVLLDPVPQLLVGTLQSAYVLSDANASDANFLAKNGRVIRGVTADGVTEAVLRIAADAEGESFNLAVIDENASSGSTADLGGLSLPGPSPRFASSLTVNAVKTDSGPMAFAVYQAPADFVRTGNANDTTRSTRTVQVQVTSPSSGTSFVQKVDILRPPIALIHGLWSRKETWFSDDFQQNLAKQTYTTVYSKENPSGTIFPEDYRDTAGRGVLFNEILILSNLIIDLQSFKRNQQVAAVQWDVVSHSMGGLITRAMPGDQRFLRVATFRKGDVHKLITIDTPHSGSELANALLTVSNHFPACAAAFRNLNHPIDEGAIADLAVGSAFFDYLGNKVQGTVKAHAVVGTTDPFFRESLTPLLLPFQTLMRCPGLVGLGGIDSLFGGPSDLIVSFDSQQSGFRFNAISINQGNISHFQLPNPFNLYAFPGQTGPIGALAASPDPTKNSGNLEFAVDLLNAPVVGGAFDDVK